MHRQRSVDSDVDHLEIRDRAVDGSGIEVVEHEVSLGVASLQVGGRLPAHVAENVSRASCFYDCNVRSDGQPVEWPGRLCVARVRGDPIVDPNAVTTGAAGAVVELDRLVLVAAGGT